MLLLRAACQVNPIERHFLPLCFSIFLLHHIQYRLQTRILKYDFVYHIVLLPVSRIADLLVLLELVTDHLQELVRVRTEILHQTH